MIEFLAGVVAGIVVTLLVSKFGSAEERLKRAESRANALERAKFPKERDIVRLEERVTKIREKYDRKKSEPGSIDEAKKLKEKAQAWADE